MTIRTVKVAKRYGSTVIEHTVTESAPDSEIKIEMPLEPFIYAVVQSVIEETLGAVGSPAAIMMRATLASKVRAGLAQRIDAALGVEIQKMKESTIYKAVEK